MVWDYYGQTLREGDRVKAWRNGVDYTATVKQIKPYDPGDPRTGIVIVREDNQAEVDAYADAVAVLH